MSTPRGLAFRPSPLAVSLACVFLVIVVSAAVFVVSRNAARDSESWYRKLARADELIASGDARNAARILLSLRKGAAGSGQWLSIYKRERSLGLSTRSMDTLKKALVKSPASESLAAVLAYALAEAGSLDDAARVAKPLRAGRFAALSASLELQSALSAEDINLIDTECLEVAYDVTGIPSFLRNAVALSAERGEMGVACEYARKLVGYDAGNGIGGDNGRDAGSEAGGRERYLAALVHYDAGLYGDALRLLDRAGTVPSAHELELRADAAWRVGNARGSEDAARAWAESTERFPDRSPVAWFNLSVALEDGSEEGRRESVRAIDSCLDRFPKYYPAVARFARLAVTREPTRRAAGSSGRASDPVSEYLIERDFLSEDARAELLPPDYTVDRAVSLLDAACAGETHALDARFLIERSRLRFALDPDKTRSNAEIWRLLERSPDDPFVGGYAVWHFVSVGEYATAFSINEGLSDGRLRFYSGLEAAMSGKLERALEEFQAGAAAGDESWVSLANIAAVHERSGNVPRAIDELSLAAGMAPANADQSRLHLRLARLLVRSRLIDRAASVLGYALELDPSNHRARALLSELERERE